MTIKEQIMEMKQTGKDFYIWGEYTVGKGWKMEYKKFQFILTSGKIHNLTYDYIPNLSNFYSAKGNIGKLPNDIIELKKMEITKR